MSAKRTTFIYYAKDYSCYENQDNYNRGNKGSAAKGKYSKGPGQENKFAGLKPHILQPAWQFFVQTNESLNKVTNSCKRTHHAPETPRDDKSEDNQAPPQGPGEYGSYIPLSVLDVKKPKVDYDQKYNKGRNDKYISEVLPGNKPVHPPYSHEVKSIRMQLNRIIMWLRSKTTDYNPHPN